MERGKDAGNDAAQAGDEPALTDENSKTVLAEDALIDDDRVGRSGDQAPAKP